MEPVFLAGSTISRATLHNEDFIKERDLRPGDTVIIEKGGEVIPKVISVVLEKRPKDSSPFEFPKVCSCELHSLLSRPDDEANYYCDHPECPEQCRRRIEHFASRDAMDIGGFGEKAISKFVSEGLLKDIADIYELESKSEEIMKFEGWGEKSCLKLFESIEKSKSQSFDRVLYGLGIRFVGEGAARILAENYKSIEDLEKATSEDLLKIFEIGKKIAASIEKYFKNPVAIEIISRLKKSGLNLKSSSDTIILEKNLSGKTFVLTGELSTMTRNEAKDRIRKLGGKVTSTVSKKTDFIIVGESPGSKYTDALKLEINTLDEKQAMELLKIE